MGAVYKVRNVISDRVEAMKVLRPEAGAEEELANRFMREIKVVASLEHPNIAQLRTALRAQDQLIMIMEYVEGSPLDELMLQKRVDMWRGVDYICQVLAALSYAHQRGVVHRDVKPPNILVTTQNVAKLTDFGIASKQGDPRLTGAGTALGSLYYMSPEQVTAATPDGRSDVYSVGVTLYELVTAQRPIQGDSFFAIMHAHLEHIPTPPRELSPQVPPELSNIILKSLAKDPAARFQTAAEFQQALRALLERTAPFAGGSPGWAAQAPAVPTASTAKAPGPLTSNSLGMSQANKTWSPELIDKLGKDLAVYVGPLARVIVNRAAKKARTLDELYNILAAEISSENDRRKFLSSRPVA